MPIRHHTKTFTGCARCRSRRIKCGEERPECLRCIKYGEPCPGYHPLRARTFEPIESRFIPSNTGLQSHSVWHKINEKRLMAVYHGYAVEVLSGYLGRSFWASIVPKIASENHVVHKGLLLAAFATEELRMNPQDPFRSSLFFDGYNDTIQSLLNESAGLVPEQVLTVCALFICCEYLQGSIRNALQHTQAGLEILGFHLHNLSTSEIRPSARHIFLRDEILPVFRGFEVQAALYAYQESPLGGGSFPLISQFSAPFIPTTFNSLFTAHHCLIGVIHFTLGGLLASEALARVDLTFLDQWLQSLQNLERTLIKNSSQFLSKEARVLRCHHMLAKGIFQHFTETSQRHILSSAFLAKCKWIISEYQMLFESNLILTFGRFTELVSPLFLIAILCQGTELQELSMELLRTMKRCETNWSSRIAYDTLINLTRGISPMEGDETPSTNGTPSSVSDSTKTCTYNIGLRSNAELAQASIMWPMLSMLRLFNLSSNIVRTAV